MNTIKSWLYSFIAPVLRRMLRNKISRKSIAGSEKMLFYEKSQHLGLLLNRRVSYESEFRNIILDHIEKDALVFEIGSNIGQYSILIAEKIGLNGKLICIEPDSDNFAYLAFNVYKNKLRQVEILNVAIGEKPGRAIFYKDTKTGGRMSSLLKQYAGDQKIEKTEEVNVITLKELVSRFGVPQFIKVDVEGAEKLIFNDPSLLHPTTTYLIEVREETKDYIFRIFKSKEFQIMNLGKHTTNIEEARQIPGFANLLIRKQ